METCFARNTIPIIFPQYEAPNVLANAKQIAPHTSLFDED